MDHDLLRHVRVEATIGRPFTLQMYATPRSDARGQTIIGYEFKGPDGATIFAAEDFAGSPMDSDDSDASVRSLLGFLTLRPGDTDREYFDKYNEAQRAFAATDAEALVLFTLDDDPLPLVDLDHAGNPCCWGCGHQTPDGKRCAECAAE